MDITDGVESEKTKKRIWERIEGIFKKHENQESEIAIGDVPPENVSSSRYERNRSPEKRRGNPKTEKYWHRKRIFFGLACGLTFFVIAGSAFFFWAASFSWKENLRKLSEEETLALEKTLDGKIPQRKAIVSPLPYSTVAANLDVAAGSAILIDASNGSILFEKNADEIIPPASMTKLFVMYIAYQEIASGRISLDDVVPLPKECWWKNLPSDSSKMYLAQGQTVTLRELLLGLAVASGNDAAIAVAYYISGNVEKFVERMNQEAKALGLKNTRFVEPSGYSENNLTTAREFASFARVYISRYPESLSDYHNQWRLAYPMKSNLPSWEKHKGDDAAVIQHNTNPLLREMEGCDGLKTGFIYESGYNLSLTAMRDGMRYISVTMQGPGRGAKEGNQWRVHDGTELFEWAFANFYDYKFDFEKLENSGNKEKFVLPVFGGKEKFLALVPAWEKTLTVPFVSGKSAKECASLVKAEAAVPKIIDFENGNVEAGKKYGEIRLKIGETVLETIPLVADRTIEPCGNMEKIFANIAKVFYLK